MLHAQGAYLLDTNVISNVAKTRHDGAGPQYPELRGAVSVVLARGLPTFVSVVSFLEFERGFARDPQPSERQRERFLRSLEVYTPLRLGAPGMDEASVCRTAGAWQGRLQALSRLEQRSRGKALRIPSVEDLLIAASAQAHGVTLLTSDEPMVSGLSLLGEALGVELLPVA